MIIHLKLESSQLYSCSPHYLQAPRSIARGFLYRDKTGQGLHEVLKSSYALDRRSVLHDYNPSLHHRSGYVGIASILGCCASTKREYTKLRNKMLSWKHDFRGKVLVGAITAATCQAFLLLGYDQGREFPSQETQVTSH
jgi:hypothetical protein